MPDLDLTCMDCGRDFYFKEKDQEFYEKQGYDLPKRCWYCRQARKQRRTDAAKSAIYKKK